MKRLPILAAALVYTAFAAFASPAAAQVLTEAQRAEILALREGEMRKLVVHEKPVPSVDATFTDPDGGEHHLSNSDGRIRFVNFWATWCAPCRQEKPALDAVQRDRGGADFSVIAIATGRNDLAGIERFNAEVGVTNLRTYLDPRSTLARAMGVPGLPVTVVLNRQGLEIARLMGGADWDAPSALAILDYLVALPD